MCIGRAGSRRLLGRLNLRDRHDQLVAILGASALDMDLGGRGAEVLVEGLTHVTGEVVRCGLVALLDLDDILATVRLLQFALRAGACAIKGNLFAVIGLDVKQAKSHDRCDAQ